MVRVLGGVACAVLVSSLAACGGGGSGRPPTALAGVSYDRFASAPGAALNLTEGGDGPGVIYVTEGTLDFLGRQIPRSNAYQADDGSVAQLAAPPGFESTRFIRIEYGPNGSPVTEGVLGRFTTDALMATASGSAVYRGGENTSDLRILRNAGESFDLDRGRTVVVVDFGTRTVDATLDFRGTPAAARPVAVVDRIEVRGMTIDGNRFSGGVLSSFKGSDPTPVPGFSASGPNLASAGVFAGWNDATGAVAGGNRPAEVGGAFVGNTGENLLKGRYLAD